MLGSVLADLVNLLNPSALILRGELSTAGAPLIEGVRASLRRYAQPATAAALRCCPRPWAFLPSSPAHSRWPRAWQPANRRTLGIRGPPPRERAPGHAASSPATAAG